MGIFGGPAGCGQLGLTPHTASAARTRTGRGRLWAAIFRSAKCENTNGMPQTHQKVILGNQQPTEKIWHTQFCTAIKRKPL